MSTVSEYSLLCPKCGHVLYVRHTQSGALDQESGKHYVTNVVWTAECHGCQWNTPKRGTEWALIVYVQEQAATSENVTP